MDYRLEPQIKNASEIKNILKEVSVTYKLADGRKVKTLLVYLPVKGGATSYDAFFEKIKESILMNFVFSYKEIKKKTGLEGKESIDELFNKAIRKLSKHTAKGELGELILFTLLDVYFEAPKILSKISLKTNSKMPVFGADAVHCQIYDGKLKLYLGESKLFKDFKSAATKAAKSIASAKDKYEEEFDLLDSHMDFPNINDDLESILLDLLNPFSENDLTDVINSPCFIGFSESLIISTCPSEDEFLKKYKELAGEYISDFFNKVETHKTNINNAALLMLPFSCVDDLVKKFVAYMGIAK